MGGVSIISLVERWVNPTLCQPLACLRVHSIKFVHILLRALVCACLSGKEGAMRGVVMHIGISSFFAFEHY